jgi:hypothetical protein
VSPSANSLCVMKNAVIKESSQTCQEETLKVLLMNQNLVDKIVAPFCYGLQKEKQVEPFGKQKDRALTERKATARTVKIN